MKIFGKEYKLRAKVEIMDSFSGHADHSELLDYFNAIKGPKKKVWLVHGETDRSEVLCEALQTIHDGEVSVAKLDDEVVF